MIDRGLVLEGGGLRGQYTAGVLDAFLEAGLAFPYVIGVSAGAGIGCSFVSKQKGRNLEIVERFRNDKRYLSFHSLLKTGSLFGMHFIFHEIPGKYIPFDFATFNASPTRFVTVCTDVDTGEAVYYEKGEDLLSVLEASGALPFLAQPVSYKGRRLLDGAIADAIPLERAHADGFRKNVIVLTRPEGYRKKESLTLPARVFYRRDQAVVRALATKTERYNTTLATVEDEERTGEAFVIRPSRDLGISRTEKDLGKLRALYELGLSDARAAIPRLG